MKIIIIHPDQRQQPVAATLAHELARALPPGTEVASADTADAREADSVLAVFSLKPGAFAPIVPCYRALRDKKVAFVAVLTGPVDAGRVRKSVWGCKKQFCGNEVVGAYLCPADDDQAWGPVESEVAKVRAFARRFYEDQAALAGTSGPALESVETPLAANY